MAKVKAKNIEIKILLPVAGKFKLSYNVGETYTVEAKQANELIEAKYAKKVN